MDPRPQVRESTTISMVVEEWKKGQTEKFSSVYRINGYPWRLRLFQFDSSISLSLRCEKTTESALWQCTSALYINQGGRNRVWRNCRMGSWFGNESLLHRGVNPGEKWEVAIFPTDNGDKWRCHPILNPTFYSLDGTLLIGDKRLHIHKESLASQSPFFECLFNGNFKEKNMKEIPIGDVEYKEFSSIVRLIHGFKGAELSVSNVHRVMELVDRFDIKIVEDKVVSFLLSSSTQMTRREKMEIADKYKLDFVKKILTP